jgi:predicted CoA-binding protein/RimJ/RimL family protein N-acetyltransferase
MLTIRTERLELKAATGAHLDAELESAARLGTLLSAQVPVGWPPGEYDRPAIEMFRARLAEGPEQAGWLVWYAIQRPGAGHEAILVAAAGFLGPPDPTGAVEVGYSVLPAYQGLGYATEIVAALAAHALSQPRVARVIAHVQASNLPSVKVLERSGFTVVGPGREPGTIEYARVRSIESPSMRGAIMTSGDAIQEFTAQKSLAVVGGSRRGRKFGNVAYRELRARGYRLFPVHPSASEIEGDRAYATFESLPEPVGGVLIVLPPEETERVVQRAAHAGIRRVWMQQGAESPDAIRFCAENGIEAVHGHCILMFTEPVRSIHRIHRWIWRALGKLPVKKDRVIHG